MHLALFSPCVDREDWTSWWEAEAEVREREAGAATEGHDCTAELHASPSCNSGCICCSRPSPWKQDGAFHWLPWGRNVAVHATCRCGYIPGSCTPPTSCLSRWLVFIQAIWDIILSQSSVLSCHCPCVASCLVRLSFYCLTEFGGWLDYVSPTWVLLWINADVHL